MEGRAAVNTVENNRAPQNAESVTSCGTISFSYCRSGRLWGPRGEGNSRERTPSPGTHPRYTPTHRSDYVVPVHTMKARWGVVARLRPFSTSAREGASGEIHTPAVLLPGTRPPLALHMKVGGPQEPICTLWRTGESLGLADRHAFSPVAQ